MHSSTSNFSSLATIGGSVIFAVALFLFYHLLITMHVVPAGGGDSTNRINLIRIENYALAEKTPKILVLGSSLLNRVMVLCHNKNVGNLCMIGRGAMDGAAVIALTKRYPEVALIEADSTLVVAPGKVAEEALPSYKVALARVSPLFLTCYKPSSVLLKICPSLPSFSIPRQEKPKAATLVQGSSAQEQAPAARPNLELIKVSRQHWLVDEPDRQLLTENLMQLKELITDMQKHGTTVCFVDIPLDPLIYEGKMEAGSRKIIEEIFPRTQYKWISPSDKKTWNTTDGLHLTPEEARAFYKDMNQQLAQILGAQTPPM